MANFQYGYQDKPGKTKSSIHCFQNSKYWEQSNFILE
jgi:hypothetical protein